MRREQRIKPTKAIDGQLMLFLADGFASTTTKRGFTCPIYEYLMDFVPAQQWHVLN
jgi:hypothetical protein